MATASRLFLVPLPPLAAARLKKKKTMIVPMSASGNSMANLELDRSKKQHKKPGNGVYLLLLANLGVYALDHWLNVRGMKQLYLYHQSPRWYQFFTSIFCHGDWGHISGNLFALYMFGKLVEEEEGGWALWASYLITGAGANLLSWLLMPPSLVSLGASGAVFGLFVISVLVKISWDWRKLLEVLILGQYVVAKVIEATSLVQDQTSNVNHLVHCAGALVGVLLIWLINRIPKRHNKDQL